MEQPNIIVIGASAGGVEALRELFGGLKPELNAAVFVVMHVLPYMKSHLPEILSKHSPIPVGHARDGAKIDMGRAYIAPPDQHLILEDGRMRLTFGPRVNHTRPAIDPLFESAAESHASSVIGVILSGSLYDGTKGLLSIKQAGGIAIVQDPEEALFPSMPESALQFVQVDYSLPVSEIASLINDLTEQNAPEQGEAQMNKPVPEFSDEEVNLIKKDMEEYEKGYGLSPRSVLTCPDCGGVLWELKEGGLVRYRCHTGHVFNAENLLSSYDDELERAFWTAIRVLVEKAAIANRLASRAKENGNEEQEAFLLSVAKEAEVEVDTIRSTWLNGEAENTRDQSAGEQADDEITQSKE
jgi:two-component system chemotaxis response regulator CheB